MDIMTILIIVSSVVGIIAITYSVKANKQIENIWNDREEFYSSDCDESLIQVKGFTIDHNTGELLWQVKYKSANFVVSDDNIKMYKYLTPQMLDIYNKEMNVPEEDRPKTVWWGFNL